MGGLLFAPTLLSCNSFNACQIAHNDVFHQLTKHVEIDCYFVCEYIPDHTIILHDVSSVDHPVDLVTMSHPRFCHLISKLSMYLASHHELDRGVKTQLCSPVYTISFLYRSLVVKLSCNHKEKPITIFVCAN